MHGIDDMYLFRTVVESGGVSAAARRLDMPKSTLARRIGELEARLGLPLYHRGGQGFSLTSFGAQCHAHCAHLAAEADKVLALADRLRNRPSGVLHVVCPPAIGAAIVEEMAAAFAASVPDVRLHLEEVAGTFDPSDRHADLIIHPDFRPLPDASLVARKIAVAEYALVAGPGALGRHAAPAHPDELAQLPCIGLGGRGAEWAWRLRRGRHTATHRFEPVFTTNVPTALLQAARLGLGVATLPLALCRNDIARGHLERVLPDWTPEPAIIYALYPGGRALTAAARRFLDMLAEHLPRRLASA